ncbi:MAG: hypothetical protein AAFY02_18415 [Pseudomonadota bacterium]
MDSGDVAFGGSGGDSFCFTKVRLGVGGSGGPMIRDFEGELLNAANGDYKLVFATELEVGTVAYIGAAGLSSAGDSQACFNGSRHVQVDQDSDGMSDIAFLVDAVSNDGQLTATDFVWLWSGAGPARRSTCPRIII